MSTRLHDACRWWANNDDAPIPSRHFKALDSIGALALLEDEQRYVLNGHGYIAMREHGYAYQGGHAWALAALEGDDA